MTLRRILVGNRRFRVRRVVGVRTVDLLDTVREFQYLLFGRRHGRRSYDSRPDGESGVGGSFELLGGTGSDGGDGGGAGE